MEGLTHRAWCKAEPAGALIAVGDRSHKTIRNPVSVGALAERDPSHAAPGTLIAVGDRSYKTIRNPVSVGALAERDPSHAAPGTLIAVCDGGYRQLDALGVSGWPVEAQS